MALSLQDVQPKKGAHLSKRQQRQNEKARANQKANTVADHAVRDQVEQEMTALIHAKKDTKEPVPVFLTLENLPAEIQEYVEANGIDAAVEEYGADQLLEWQMCVMWNDLPPAKIDDKKYQVHFHVEYRNLDLDGPKEIFEKNEALDKLRKQLEEQEEKLSKGIKNKQKRNKARNLRSKLSKEVKALEAVPKVSKGFAKHNSHIYAPPDLNQVSNGPYKRNGNYSRRIGACGLLQGDAIAAALQFKAEALRDTAHFKKAVRKRRPEFLENDDTVEKGKAIVEWHEDKGENRLYGFKLYMKKGDDEKEQEQMVWTHLKTKGANAALTAHPFTEVDLKLITRSVEEAQAVKKFLSASKNRDWTNSASKRAARHKTQLDRKSKRPSDDHSDDEEHDIQYDEEVPTATVLDTGRNDDGQQQYDGHQQHLVVRQQAALIESTQGSQ